MVTKGIVEKVLSKYYARVRIPIYDGVEDSQGSTNNVNLSSAIVCSLPNSIVTLAKDDIVYVTFEDDDIGKPVIIGWLQKGTGNNSEIGLTLSTLTTKSTTFLDKQTYIGNIQPFEIQKLENVRDNIQGQIDLANSNIDDVGENLININKDLQHKIDLINTTIIELQNIKLSYNELYPVGSLYFSATGVSPFDVPGISAFNWSKVEGKFLLGSGTSSQSTATTYTLGNSGGSKDAIVVEHDHSIKLRNTTAGISRDYGTNGDHVCAQTGGDLVWNSSWVNSTGSSGTDMNMPPYLVIDIWQRLEDNI